MNIAAQRGFVREFDHIKGRGLIENEEGDFYPVRYSAILGEGVRSLRIGDPVSFEVECTQKGFNAVRVERTKQS